MDRITLHTEIDGDVELDLNEIGRIELLDDGVRVFWEEQAEGHESDYV